jgi:hypothetical protein
MGNRRASATTQAAGRTRHCRSSEQLRGGLELVKDLAVRGVALRRPSGRRGGILEGDKGATEGVELVGIQRGKRSGIVR